MRWRRFQCGDEAFECLGVEPENGVFEQYVLSTLAGRLEQELGAAFAKYSRRAVDQVAVFRRNLQVDVGEMDGGLPLRVQAIRPFCLGGSISSRP